MRILISPTAFKGTVPPDRAAKIIASEFRRIRGASITVLPVADGGDGTLNVLRAAFGARLRRSRVRGPLGAPVRAAWAVSNMPALGARRRQGHVSTAIIEMARASGIALVKGRNRVLDATTEGTGQLLSRALRAGCRQIVIGVGGTATADGGAGALHALGLRYVNHRGRSLSPAPHDLISLDRVDARGLDRRLASARLFVACDVKNPLLGRRGSARTFGPQKGATPAQVSFLERVMRRWSRFAVRQTRDKPGAGAAGALAFGLSAFAGATLVDGASFILNAIDWPRAARTADVIVTGEGRLDATSFNGKAVGAVAARRGRARVHVICGASALTRAAARRAGVDTIWELGPAGLQRPEAALRAAARRVARSLQEKSSNKIKPGGARA
jgi:glycerate kinase